MNKGQKWSVLINEGQQYIHGLRLKGQVNVHVSRELWWDVKECEKVAFLQFPLALFPNINSICHLLNC